MPVKRRTPKGRVQYPEPIQRLVDGDPLEFSEENRNAVLGVCYFNDYPGLSQEVRQRAGDLLTEWPNDA
jgi:hypothetical protein